MGIYVKVKLRTTWAMCLAQLNRETHEKELGISKSQIVAKYITATFPSRNEWSFAYTTTCKIRGWKKNPCPWKEHSVTCRIIKLPAVIINPKGLPDTYSFSLNFQINFW